MVDKNFIGGYLDANIWFSNHSTNDNAKVKIFDSHPVKPLFVSVDHDNRIVVMDYNIKKELLNIVIGNLVATCSSDDTFNNMNMPNIAFRYRISDRADCVSTFRESDMEKVRPSFNNSGVNNSNSAAVTVKKGSHNVKHVSFVDSATIYNTDVSHFESVLLIVCDHHVMTYNYVTRTGWSIAESDLTNKQPTAAEFLNKSILAVGCVDGVIRLWDYEHKRIVKSLVGHSKGPIGVLKVVAPNNYSRVSKWDNIDQRKGRIRLISFGSDGAVLIWDLCCSVTSNLDSHWDVDIENSNSINTATARLKELLGVSATGVNRNNIHYDSELNSLLICTGDRKIKVWDLNDVNMAHSQRRAQSIQQAKSAANKRQSVLMSVVGGGREGQYADIFGINCVASVKPGDKRDKRVEVAAFSTLRSPLCGTDTFILCSKTNNIGIYKSRESQAGDDKSERSSVVTTNSEKSQRLQLIQEYSLSELMVKYLAALDSTVAEPVKDVLRNGAVKVYSLKTHATQPHIVLLGTSVGIVVLCLPFLPCGPLSGAHPRWGASKLVFANSSVRKITLESTGSPSSETQGSTITTRFSDLDNNETQQQGVNFEVLHELTVSDEQRPPQVLGSKRLSFASAGKKTEAFNGSAAAVVFGKPTFHPSPSGQYCALLWNDTMMYIVLRVGATGNSKIAENMKMTELDRGYCLEFAWVGSQDCFLIKTPPQITTSSAPKLKRGSIMGGLLFGGEKEVKRLCPSKLLLFQCGQSSVHSLKFDSSCFLQHSIIGMFGGPLVAVNSVIQQEVASTIKKTTDGVVDGGLDASVHETAVEGIVITDLEKIEHEIKNTVIPPKSRQRCGFYCLVSSSEAGRLRNLWDSKIVKPKLQKSKTQNNELSNASEVAAATTADESNSSCLISIGPVFCGVDAVRWDVVSGKCAVLIGHSVVNILQLGMQSDGVLSFTSLSCVTVAPPIEVFSSTMGMLWDCGVLLVTIGSSVQVISVFVQTVSATAETIVLEKEQTSKQSQQHVSSVVVKQSSLSLDASLSRQHHLVKTDISTATAHNMSSWVEPLGLHYGSLFAVSRDSHMDVIPLARKASAAFLVVANLAVNTKIDSNSPAAAGDAVGQSNPADMALHLLQQMPSEEQLDLGSPCRVL